MSTARGHRDENQPLLEAPEEIQAWISMLEHVASTEKTASVKYFCVTCFALGSIVHTDVARLPVFGVICVHAALKKEESSGVVRISSNKY